MNEDYKAGYREGFLDGYTYAAKLLKGALEGALEKPKDEPCESCTINYDGQNLTYTCGTCQNVNALQLDFDERGGGYYCSEKEGLHKAFDTCEKWRGGI